MPFAIVLTTDHKIALTGRMKTFIVNEEVLHQNAFDNQNELKNLTSEMWSSALLDCGASKTVCGK